MGADAIIRANMDSQSVPEIESDAFTPAPALATATVAIVSTAGFRLDGQPSWKANDAGYRLFDRGERGLKLGHLSPNFDRSGMAADLNIAHPIDRREEMVHGGVLGDVARRHASFMGAQDELMESIREDTAPKLAEELRADGTDVVLLVPV